MEAEEAIEEEGRETEREIKRKEGGIGIRKVQQPVNQLGYFGCEKGYDGTDFSPAMRELVFPLTLFLNPLVFFFL